MSEIKNQYNETQKKALAELKTEEAWKIVMDMCDTIIKRDCNLNNINVKLSDKEFKIEYQSRKKAKKIFTAIFGEPYPLKAVKKTYL